MFIAFARNGGKGTKKDICRLSTRPKLAKLWAGDLTVDVTGEIFTCIARM